MVPVAVTIYGVCAVSFMMAMYALERRGPIFVLLFAVGCLLSSAYGNVVTGYTGTIHFTSSDVQAVLPANYTFTTADGGMHRFTATLKILEGALLQSTNADAASDHHQGPARHGLCDRARGARRDRATFRRDVMASPRPTGLVWHELLMWHDTAPLAGFLKSGRGVIEPDEPSVAGAIEDGEVINPHGMDPQTVLRFVKSIGAWPGRVIVIACEPADAEEVGWGLSQHVEDAVERAVGLVVETIDSLRAQAVRGSAP